MKNLKMVPVSVITLEATERRIREELSRLPQYHACGTLAEMSHSALILEGDAHLFAYIEHARYGQPGIVIPGE